MVSFVVNNYRLVMVRTFEFLFIEILVFHPLVTYIHIHFPKIHRAHKTTFLFHDIGYAGRGKFIAYATPSEYFKLLILKIKIVIPDKYCRTIYSDTVYVYVLCMIDL